MCNQFQNQCEVLKLFVRSLRTVCPEPSHNLCAPSWQTVRTFRTRPKQPLSDSETGFIASQSSLYETLKVPFWDPEAGYIASPNRLRQVLKKAPSGSKTGSVRFSNSLFLPFFRLFFLVFPRFFLVFSSLFRFICHLSPHLSPLNILFISTIGDGDR